ncbi:hypothetical protein K461DRAFT_282138 [Myriangium duriaei CBS 260.36]|uniref:Uncharacterized protein n=1 Tax=Myriangium duriaei CBS 260.36 TaxID=1168546 RepID=A0A9P4IUI4_9PEZI|nr:hypothetical protein K461DRAFT_282138 [Myriangium duriaei CBS 260.36]
MSSINPALLVLCVMLGGGFVVMICAAVHRILRSDGDWDPHARSTAQDAYMREVRGRTWGEITGRPLGARGLGGYRVAAGGDGEETLP